MVFKNLCILILGVKVALALEGLRASLVVEAMLHHIMLHPSLFIVTLSATLQLGRDQPVEIVGGNRTRSNRLRDQSLIAPSHWQLFYML